jgi:hypothetical protein
LENQAVIGLIRRMKGPGAQPVETIRIIRNSVRSILKECFNIFDFRYLFSYILLSKYEFSEKEKGVTKMEPSERKKLSKFLDWLWANDLPLDIWADLVGGAIRKACPQESKILTKLGKLESSEKINKEEYLELLTHAKAILEHKPTESPDPALEREIMVILKD